MSKKRNLLESDDEEDDEASRPVLKVNQSYAQKYVERKKKEELSKLKELHGDVSLADSSEEDSESESEDEDAELLTDKIERTFMELIPMIRNKDPRIYDPNFKAFESDGPSESGRSTGPSEDEANEEEEKEEEKDKGEKKRKKEKKEKKEKKKKKPLTVSDYMRDRLLKLGPEKAAESDEEDDELPKLGPSLQEEQDELKRAFWKSVEEMEQDGGIDGGELLRQRKKTKEEKEKEEREYAEWKKEKDKKTREQRLLDPDNVLARYWQDPNLDENEKFLREHTERKRSANERSYVLGRKWKQKDDEELPTYDQIVGNDDGSHSKEDEKALDAQDAFEAKYNFRHEEPGGTELKSYPRVIEDSVRKKESSRKRKREEKKRRKEEEKLKKKEELKRLKALKREELRKKIEKIQRISGMKEAPGLKEEDLEDEYDPERFDKQMAALFSDEYYNAEEEAEGKPQFSEDDEDLSFSVPEQESTADKLLKQKAEEAKKKQKEKDEARELDKEEFQKLLDEYYALDYEDIIAGQPVRFRYVKVPPKSYGLSIEDIICMDDKDLNRVVSLKKLAPYRDPAVVKRAEQRLQEIKAKAADPSAAPPQLIAGESKKAKKRKEKKRRRKEKERAAAVEAADS